MQKDKPIDIVRQFIGIFSHAIDKHYGKISKEHKDIVLTILTEEINNSMYNAIELLNEKNVEQYIKSQLKNKITNIHLF